jgi:hypothetical protein
MKTIGPKVLYLLERHRDITRKIVAMQGELRDIEHRIWVAEDDGRGEMPELDDHSLERSMRGRE